MDENTYLSKTYIGQSHSECFCNSDFSVILVNRHTGAQIQIVEKDGTICNFPGIENCEALSAEMDVSNLPGKVKYSAEFKKQENGGYWMIWTIRPDGRFWMDSWGFGAEDYEWVDLYAYIDENGRFTSPFKLHSIGYHKFTDTVE